VCTLNLNSTNGFPVRSLNPYLRSLRYDTATATACPSPCDTLARRANFRFAKTPNQWPISGHPVPTRGAVARRHERGMGCGGRESVGAQMRSQGGLNLVSDWQARRTNDAMPGEASWRRRVVAYGKTVWS
jgi:hypothetical protein